MLLRLAVLAPGAGARDPRGHAGVHFCTGSPTVTTNGRATGYPYLWHVTHRRGVPRQQRAANIRRRPMMPPRGAIRGLAILMAAGVLGHVRPAMAQAVIGGALQDEMDLRPASAVASPPYATPVRLGSPHPNPTRSTATLALELPFTATVRADVFDLVGRHIGMFVDGELEAAVYQLRVEGTGLAPGVYVVRALVSGGGEVHTMARRFTLVR